MTVQAEVGTIFNLMGCNRNYPDGVISFDESSALEQVVLSITFTEWTFLSAIWLDMINATQDITIRSKYKIDGANYRTFDNGLWTFGVSDVGQYAGGGIFKHDFQMTMQCGGAGVGVISIPYSMV